MRTIRQIILVAVTIVAFHVCHAQKPLPKNVAPLFTADSLATGNYKDVLTSFFQLAFNNLTGPNKELRFTTSPFAVMARANPELLIDTNYYRYRALRKLNFGFAVKLDTSYRFNGFSSSVKYALIDQRDITVSRDFVIDAYAANDEFNRLNDSLQAHAVRIQDTAHRRRIREYLTAIFRDSSSVQFNKLPDSIQNLLRTIANRAGAENFLKLVRIDPTINIRKASQTSFQTLKERYQNKILWTVGANDTTYKDQFAFSNIVLYTSFLKGVLDPANKSNLELDIKSFFNLRDDTALSGRDLKRAVFSFEPGINWVLKTKGTHQSFFEFLFNGSYHRVFNGLYPGEKQNKLHFHGTLRVRIYADIWIPLQFRYEPDNGNWFGFLHVRANFNSVNSLLKNL